MKPEETERVQDEEILPSSVWWITTISSVLSNRSEMTRERMAS